MNNLQYEFRKANVNDNLEEISELLYMADQYIYPYWFQSLEKGKKELSKLLIEDKFIFNINNIYIVKDNSANKIIAVVCVIDKSVDLDYDYSKLEKINDRYKFTINNYIKGLISEVKEAEFAYISNVCVHPDYRGRHIGNMMIREVIDIYRKKCFNELSLVVLSDNPGAIKLYKNLGFEQTTCIREGFNGPDEKKPDVFSMKNNLYKE